MSFQVHLFSLQNEVYLHILNFETLGCSTKIFSPTRKTLPNLVLTEQKQDVLARPEATNLTKFSNHIEIKK